MSCFFVGVEPSAKQPLTMTVEYQENGATLTFKVDSPGVDETFAGSILDENVDEFVDFLESEGRMPSIPGVRGNCQREDSNSR